MENGERLAELVLFRAVKHFLLHTYTYYQFCAVILGIKKDADIHFASLSFDIIKYYKGN